VVKGADGAQGPAMKNAISANAALYEAVVATLRG
jgi:hypothetical protein